METENRKKNKLTKSFWLWVIIISVFLMIGVAVGFYFFSNREVEVVEKTKNGGNLALNYSSDVSGLSIVNAIPTMDDIGIKNMTEGKYFDFSIETSLDDADIVEYEISITKDEASSTINDEDIRIYLEKEESGTYTKVFGPEAFAQLEKKTELGTKKGSMVVAKVKKKDSSTDNYRLRMWLAGSGTTKTGNYSVEIDLNGNAK